MYSLEHLDLIRSLEAFLVGGPWAVEQMHDQNLVFLAPRENLRGAVPGTRRPTASRDVVLYRFRFDRSTREFTYSKE